MTEGTEASLRPSVADAVILLCRRLEEEEPSAASQVRVIRERLDEPLRVAIAGRVKAGKSTLVNALVGERLAPTDAGECTRIVTVYSHGMGYEVSARLRSGEQELLAFRRTEGSLAIDLGAHSELDVAAVEVHWPSPALGAMTLIDTPGLASANDTNSRRTVEFLGIGFTDGAAGDADAVIYMMRHVHETDVAFLDAFMDRTVTAASPVNTVAVLSRADEIGAGRIDAMESTARIARRYESHPELRQLCSAVLPLAGLLAETGLTLREDEAAAIRRLVSTDPDVLERMLLSVEEFLAVSASDLTVEWRRDLVDRLGMFGLRVAIREVRAGATTAAELGPRLVECSGLQALKRLIADRFLPRARVLQARTALSALRSLAAELRGEHPSTAAQIERAVEEIEASTLDFARMRCAHLLASGAIEFEASERAQLEQLFLLSGAAALGMNGASAEQVRQGALEAVARWRERGSDPLARAALSEICDTAARSCEEIFLSASGAHPWPDGSAAAGP